MTVADRHAAEAYSSWRPAAAPPDAPTRLFFVDNRGEYWRLMIRGAALQAITLGIYRFWLFTDMRRFLWANTEVEGESFEYTGTAVELLLGFLMAIGILIPIYAMLFLASLEFGLLSRLSGIFAFVVLAGFGQYASYRARRYRLTRTVFRGLRFHQTGSPVLYALRAMLWSVVVTLTIGLAYPWMQASLERYKMRNTFYGDLDGAFTGAGWRLFGRGFLIWLLVLGPLVAGLAGAIAMIDWPLLERALARGLAGGTLPNVLSTMQGNAPTAQGLGLLVAGVSLSVVLGVFLYPAYQAVAMRWWLGGLRIGGAAAASDLRMRRYYGAYLRYILYVLLFSVAFAVAVAIVLGIGYAALGQTLDFSARSLARDGVAAGSLIVVYVVYILGCSTIYQVVVKMRLWQVAVESVEISGLEALDHVHATEATSSAVGEGLADALGTGGI
jgi:uncharacterized membrane protein YjgN (DUF898 family)